MNYVIEKMSDKHIDGVLALEKLCFPRPWTRAMFKGELSNAAARYIVCVAEGRVIGYAGCWYTSDGGDITNVAVHPDFRRAGLGEALVVAMIDEAKTLCLHHMTLEVRVSNEPAIALYKKHGFVPAGVRRRYYADNGEDAIIMIKEW